MPSPSLRILVVEDDPLVRDVVCEQLKEAKHQPVGSENGQEALEIFKTGNFDLVITDHSMPGMSGVELAATLKRINPAIPVILLTGYGDMLDGAVAAYFDLAVSKPFTFNLLRESIAKVMKK